MQRGSRTLGGSLDHDRLDLGPEAGDPAALEFPRGSNRVAVLIDGSDQVVDTLHPSRRRW